MPFVYFGSKHGLAPKYAPPAFGTIIEPFAGAAGYACHWATPGHRVILCERNPDVVAIWRRLQSMSHADLARIPPPVAGEPVTDSIVNFWTNETKARIASSRGEHRWPSVLARIASKLELIRHWEIIEGDYTEAPDIRATWFIDPPYWVPPDEPGKRGAKYPFGSDLIDYPALGEWCQARKGQIIVCEQEGATWLPFRPFRYQKPTNKDAVDRLEVVWQRNPGPLVGGATVSRKKLSDAAMARRSAGRRKRDARR